MNTLTKSSNTQLPLCCFVLHFSELLQSLDMCENDPVAIARCFVDKVRGTILLKQMYSDISLSQG